jgi:riboflavin kinase / FMN adenylyltransferase
VLRCPSLTPVQLIRDLARLPEELRGGAVSIGNFDGVHRGHARIVSRLLARAGEVGGPAVAFTLDPHPAKLLRPDAAPPDLCSTERKARLLERLGVDGLVAYPTDRALLDMEAEEFFDSVVRERLAARAVVEGHDFFFGHNRGGNVELLDRLCRRTGMVLDVVEPVEADGEPISSSRIRELVRRGGVDRARAMLTEPYRIRGQVVRGAGRGAALGFPTANLTGIDTLVPGAGIYAGRAWVRGCEVPYPAAISVGSNPTFDESDLKVEPYLIGYDGPSLYGQALEIDFLARLRDIVRFDSVVELVGQMERDVDRARQIVEQYAAGHGG